MSDDWNSTVGRLREQASKGFGKSWIPEKPGDELVGYVRAVKPAVRTPYGSVPVLELEEPNGTAWSLWLLHTVLRREVWRVRPIAGELLYVRYDGKITPDSGGAAYESYSVLVDRPESNEPIDWEAIARHYDPDAFEDAPPEITRGPDRDVAAGPGIPAPEADEEDIPF